MHWRMAKLSSLDGKRSILVLSLGVNQTNRRRVGRRAKKAVGCPYQNLLNPYNKSQLNETLTLLVENLKSQFSVVSFNTAFNFLATLQLLAAAAAAAAAARGEN